MLHTHCFYFLLGLALVSRENKKIAYAKFWRTNKEYYGIFEVAYWIWNKYAILQFFSKGACKWNAKLSGKMVWFHVNDGHEKKCCITYRDCAELMSLFPWPLIAFYWHFIWLAICKFFVFFMIQSKVLVCHLFLPWIAISCIVISDNCISYSQYYNG